MSIRDHAETVEERWQREMKAALPPWIDAIKPATVSRTSIGVQLTVHCHCIRRQHRQVAVRCAPAASQFTQAQLLLDSLLNKHGSCHAEKADSTLPDPQELKNQMDQLRRKLKRKSEDLKGLEQQLCSKQTTERAKLQPELAEVKKFRQAGTKAANKRAVDIDSANREEFEHPQNKSDALDHKLYGMDQFN